MDASVNLKMSPQEYGTMVRAMEDARASALADGDDPELEPRDRRAAKAEAVALGLLLEKVSHSPALRAAQA